MAEREGQHATWRGSCNGEEESGERRRVAVPVTREDRDRTLVRQETGLLPAKPLNQL